MSDTAPATEADIAAYLARDTALDPAKVEPWARYLAGLSWPYVRPLVKVAVNTGNHPAMALAVAAAYSDDEDFKAAAAAHLAAQP